MIAFWNYFIYFAVVAVLLWATGAYAAWKDRKVVAYSATIAGLVVFFSYILVMWITLDRPPMRTMGETRLWYSLFLPLAGVIVYSRWDYKWLLSFSTILSMVFIGVNLLKPEIHSKTLMPALQVRGLHHTSLFICLHTHFWAVPLLWRLICCSLRRAR